MPTYRENNDKINKTKVKIQIVILMLFLIYYILYGAIIWAFVEDISSMDPKKVEIEKEYDQGVFFPLAWIILLSYTLL